MIKLLFLLMILLLVILCSMLGVYGTANGKYFASYISGKLCDIVEAHSKDDKVKISGDNMTIDSSVHDDSVVPAPTSLTSNHHHVSNDKAKDFKNAISRNTDFPSFDLGFD